MTSGTSKEKKADPEVVQKIIYTLKSKGCFDQFRKEFIADADTKPAYHNLQQRVEAYVSRFLSQQKWSQDLNKNQLRENLRRQINQSGMLNKGVERIVEQIVNPKISQVIKPKTDEVTCEHLNISLTEHNNTLKRKQLEQQEKLMKSPDSAGIHNLLAFNFSSPPPGAKAPPFSSTSSPAVPAIPPGQFNPVPPGSGILGPSPSQFPPQMSFSNTNPSGLTFPGISQQTFPFLPPGWNASLNTGFPPLFPPGQLPFQTFSIPPPGTAMTVPPPAAGPMLIPPVSSTVNPSTSISVAKPSPGKGLNALLGLPTPSDEPPPPGTVVLPDGTHIQKKKPGSKDEDKSGSEFSGQTVQDIPIPYSAASSAEQAINEQIQEAFNEEMAKAGIGEQVDKDGDDQTGGKRPYRFAWDEEIQEEDLEDSVPSSDVSSVHTSDLSHFEESEASSDSDLEDLENKLLLLQKEEKKEEPDVKTETIEDSATDLTVGEDTTTPIPHSISPVKSQPDLPGHQVEPTMKKELNNKPRKLLSLQYNYSDSDDEETREERKARIAREKEDRYQRRLQRRAELEAKRKEREEERLRQRREKLQRAKEAQDKAEREKAKDTADKEPIEKETLSKEVAEADNSLQELTVKEETEVKEEVNDKLHDSEEVCTETAVDSVAVTDANDVDVKEKIVEKTEVNDELDEKENEVDTEVPELIKAEENSQEVIEQDDQVMPVLEASEVVEPSTVDTNEESAETHQADGHTADVSLNTESSTTATESSVTLDNSLADAASSPEKKKQKKKTKAELKAELKEQKVMERKSRRQRIRNRRYMSDEFVYKGLPSANLHQSYDGTMVIEETVEMVEIDSEQPTFEFDGTQVELVEIPLPDGGESHPVTMETVEFTEVDIPEDGGEVLVANGETFTVISDAAQDEGIQIEGETVIDESAPGDMMEVTMADTAASESGRITTRSRSKNTDDMKSNSSDHSDTKAETGDSKRKRKRNSSQSETSEPVIKRQQQPNMQEGRQLRNKDGKTKKSYKTEDLYKPRHSFARKNISSPPPLPSEPPPPPSEPAPPPLPPLPPPPSESPVGEKDGELPQAPDSPDASDSDASSDRSSREARKRKRHSKSKSRSPKRSRKKSRSRSSSSSSSRKRSGSYSSKSSYSRKRSRSRSLSSISSESRSRSYSRSYSRSRSRSRSGSGSRSVSRSRSRSISSISSKRSEYSDDSEERRRKARPLEDVDFGEAAKRARHNAMMPPFGPRGPVPMGPRPPMVPMGPRGPMGPGPFPRMPPMGPRGPRGMVRGGMYPSPRHVGPDGAPIRPPVGSPGKPYFPPGGPRYKPPGPWDDPIRPRPPYVDDDYYPPEDVHEGPGKTGITERGTLYREDKSPSPPPIPRRPVYTPPYREGSISPPIPTGITERGTLYREDKSPTPPQYYRRRVETSPPPPPSIRTRHRMESVSPSPPPVLRKRTVSARSDSYESISPSPPPHTSRRLSASPPHHPVRRMTPPPVQRNTPPVLRHSRPQMTGTPSPPSSGELTPSPPDLRAPSHSPVSPGPLGPVSPLSPRGPASPAESISSPDDLAPGSPPSLRRSRRHRKRDPGSPSSSPEPMTSPRPKHATRNSSSLEEEPGAYSSKEGRSKHKKSKRSKR